MIVLENIQFKVIRSYYLYYVSSIHETAVEYVISVNKQGSILFCAEILKYAFKPDAVGFLNGNTYSSQLQWLSLTYKQSNLEQQGGRSQAVI